MATCNFDTRYNVGNTVYICEYYNEYIIEDIQMNIDNINDFIVDALNKMGFTYLEDLDKIFKVEIMPGYYQGFSISLNTKTNYIDEDYTLKGVIKACFEQINENYEYYKYYNDDATTEKTEQEWEHDMLCLKDMLPLLYNKIEKLMHNIAQDYNLKELGMHTPYFYESREVDKEYTENDDLFDRIVIVR